MQSSPGVDRPSAIAWPEILQGAISLANRLRVTLNTHGVPMMSQVLIQGLVL